MNENFEPKTEETEAVNIPNEPQFEEQKPEQPQGTFDGFSEAIYDDLQNGLHSLLFKRINSVNIVSDIRIREAFNYFTKNVECGKDFSIAELLLSAESCVTGGNLDINAGNPICIVDNLDYKNKKLASKVLKNSVGNIYSLFALGNGVTIDIDLVGGSILAGETKRFVILPENKLRKLKKTLEKSGVTVTRVGEMLSMNRIILSRDDEVIASVDKTAINSNCETVSVTVGIEQSEAYLSAYKAVMSLSLCDQITNNNVIKFGLGNDISTAFSRALGYFYALSYLKNLSIRLVFTPDNSVNVAVARPNAADGDYLYLLRVHNDPFGLPDKSHFTQLLYYLSEKKRTNVIKDVLPTRSGIQSVFARLANESLEFVPLVEPEDYGFGVIVSVPRGESVNGIKLGYYKNI